MKKIVLVLLSTFLLFSCSSDDSGFDITISESDLQVAGDEGKYYKSDNINLFILDINDILCSGNRKCPNDYEHKNEVTLGAIGYSSIDNTGVRVWHISCVECKAGYILPSGKSVEKGNGTVEMYNVTYNSENKTYRVWK